MGVGSVRWNTTVGGLAVLAVLATVTVLLPWVNDQVRVDRPLTPGAACLIGAGALVTPPLGVELDLDHSRPGRDGGQLVLRVPGQDLRYVLVAYGYDGSLDAAVTHVGVRLRHEGGYPAGAPTSIKTDGGAVGRQGGYQVPRAGTGAAARGGRYAVVIVTGPVLVTAYVIGRADLLERAAGSIDATFRSITGAGRS